MNNYKIKVNDEAESKEAQELFFELGFQWIGEEKGAFWNCEYCSEIFANEESKLLYGGVTRDFETYKELTLPQLRDLVVLHRNDVKDGTYKHRDGSIYYIASDNAFYLFSGTSWIKSLIETSEHLIKINEEPEQGLISGADTLRALADGDRVEFNSQNKWLDIRKYPWDLNILLNNPDGIKFRLKPRTIKLELEIPAPFEPKVGEVYWFISSTHRDGYDFTEYEGTNTDHMFMLYGAFKSEQNIIAVRDALRGIKQ